MEKIKALVFDLDGTLVDSIQDIAQAVNTVLALHGRPTHSLDSYRKMVGWGLRNLLAAASQSNPFTPEEIDLVFTQLMVEYRSKPVVHSVLYPGIGQMLELAASRVPMAVLSNKEHSMTCAVVGALMAPVPFHFVVGAKPGVPHKPDPQALLEIVRDWGLKPQEVAFVGDSDVDMQTAVRGGLRPLGAAWGFRGQKELWENGAEAVFDHPDDLTEWIDRHG